MSNTKEWWGFPCELETKPGGNMLCTFQHQKAYLWGLGGFCAYVIKPLEKTHLNG